MSKDQERSFVGQLTFDHRKISFFDQQLPASLFQPNYDGGPVPLAAYPPNIVTVDQHYVFLQSVHEIPPQPTPGLLVHFWCYEDYYNLEILEGPYQQKYISKNSSDILGAFPAAGGETTSFNLLDKNHNIITLDDIASDKATIFLKARNAGIIRQKIWKKPINKPIFTDREGKISTFQLTILERSVSVPRSFASYV